MLVRRVWPGRPTFNASLSDFEQARQEMLRLFDSMANESPTSPSGVFPPLNVGQDEDNVFVRAEIPGINPEQLSISVLRNRVSIAGKREIQLEQGRAAYHRRERPEGSFSRTLTLGKFDELSEELFERLFFTVELDAIEIRRPGADPELVKEELIIRSRFERCRDRTVSSPAAARLVH